MVSPIADSVTQRIFAEYTRLRKTGVSGRDVLFILRNQLSKLTVNDRAPLAEMIRLWERDPELVNPHSASTENASLVGRLNTKAIFQLNHFEEDFNHPGALPSLFDTREVPAEAPPRRDRYTRATRLALLIRTHRSVLRLRPQDREGEMVIGRKVDVNSMIVPDVDLTDYGAEGLGVSRLHLALCFNAENNTLSVCDLNSVNGSYLNGQRLHPREMRVLCDGDRLRLGELDIEVRFD